MVGPKTEKMASQCTNRAIPKPIRTVAEPLSEFIGEVAPFLGIANTASRRRNGQHGSPV